MGLNHGYLSPTDIYKPLIRSYSSDREEAPAFGLHYLRLAPSVELLDISTVWKGLSLAEADELYHINQTFGICIEELVASELHELDQEFLQVYPPQYIGGFEGQEYPASAHRIAFNLQQLVRTMYKLLQQIGYYTSNEWPDLLLLYLTTCDYITDIKLSGPQDTFCMVRMQCNEDLTLRVPRGATAEIAWSPDFLSFEHLDTMPREGQEIRVIPRYRSGAFPESDNLLTSITYSLESALPWLVWDVELQGFKGTVPMFSEVRRSQDHQYGNIIRGGREGPHAVINLLRVEIKALLTERSSTSARLERITRARLTLKVIPWYAHTSACAPDDASVKSLNYQYPVHGSPVNSSDCASPDICLKSSGNTLRKRSLDCQGRFIENGLHATEIESSHSQFIDTQPTVHDSKTDMDNPVFNRDVPHHVVDELPDSLLKEEDEFDTTRSPKNEVICSVAEPDRYIYLVDGMEDSWYQSRPAEAARRRSSATLVDGSVATQSRGDLGNPSTHGIDTGLHFPMIMDNSCSYVPPRSRGVRRPRLSAFVPDAVVGESPSTIVGRRPDRRTSHGLIHRLAEQVTAFAQDYTPRSEYPRRANTRWHDKSLDPATPRARDPSFYEEPRTQDERDGTEMFRFLGLLPEGPRDGSESRERRPRATHNNFTPPPTMIRESDVTISTLDHRVRKRRMKTSFILREPVEEQVDGQDSSLSLSTSSIFNLGAIDQSQMRMRHDDTLSSGEAAVGKASKSRSGSVSTSGNKDNGKISDHRSCAKSPLPQSDLKEDESNVNDGSNPIETPQEIIEHKKPSYRCYSMVLETIVASSSNASSRNHSGVHTQQRNSDSGYYTDQDNSDSKASDGVVLFRRLSLMSSVSADRVNSGEHDAQSVSSYSRSWRFLWSRSQSLSTSEPKSAGERTIEAQTGTNSTDSEFLREREMLLALYDSPVTDSTEGDSNAATREDVAMHETSERPVDDDMSQRSCRIKEILRELTSPVVSDLNLTGLALTAEQRSIRRALYEDMKKQVDNEADDGLDILMFDLSSEEEDYECDDVDHEAW